ncbi:hypothetical protein HN51_052661 [Arachis hypogaea]|uniref:G-type lectin S-receptor-like serine/threonine-protein kinase At5g35370 n=1 Tax=Arachis hypogaea TaxID=3818 RepID=UPI000A2B8F6C|nr:G-type lectin S-receptor-like serine/threonine-protein kinase At5g35370 isoform X1 [Arachis ipaensis]XP_020962052.1 G-type lectin S-receptor-like serine/threonine-protein kinase At5g35370 isoform X1 [Arachis ipaensis]XP_025668184.1 G-type lectin S-receptor-like serine/threonine-protein kinase At5g35370 [Arachis hypogaea]QHN94050.1 G-type lectin S-receptor-like serine/threonine-protein kinase [Arachis hypogaea]
MKPSIIFSSLLIIFLIFTATATISGYTFKAITPNFSATYLEFIDDSGTFLISPNGTFKAAIFNPGSQQTSFYLCIIHVASRTITWSANRGRAVSSSGQMNLTVKGITISDESGRNNPVWSTPPLRSQVGRLVLTDMGNLLLLDPSNVSLWESFRYPTDTIIIGQSLPVGSSLSSSSSDSDLSIGSYNLTITSSDAILQWLGQTYWKLSMDTKAYRNSLSMVEYMAVNRTGFYLFGSNGTVAVFLVGLPESNFRVATLDNSGHFVIKSFSSGTGWKQEFQGPDDGCGTPLVCGRVGLCNDDDTSSSSSSSSSSSLPVCSCPQNFHVGSGNSGGCVPSNGSYSFPYSCDGSNNDSYHNNNQSNSSSSVVSFLNLGNGLDYFHNIYTDPVMDSVDLSLCQDQCSKNCSCLGVFYRNSSGSCYVIENELGSILSSNDGANQDMFGFIKVSIGSTTTNDDTRDVEDGGGGFPVVAAVLLPITGFALLMAFLFFLWRRSIKISKRKQDLELGKPNNNYSHSSGDLDAFYIPGLPRRFDYDELKKATDDFKTLIGSGGFGTVYKGVLSDNAVVAVKKIVNIGVQGKKDFCTEIAVIGNIHHVNLVKLKGFCVQGRHRFLVYEYMNLGSLDRTLFGGGPPLEWQERYDVALGTARGLAYLHGGCEHKIIHCDIKPENILLHNHFQVKISDFGLSKLLSPEQSGLFTTMRGTRGYLAPEWLTNSAITEKTDVYSYGMVLLELISGRKNCYFKSRSHSIDEDSNSGGRGGGGGHNSSSSSTSGLLYFPLLALEKHEEGNYMDLADPRLEGRVTNEEVEKLVRIALCCVHEEPALRPNMAAVVGMLEGGMPLPQPKMESLNFLRFYGRRFTEASMIIEENNDNEGGRREVNNNSSSSMTSGGSQAALVSYISSQTVSGPR